MAKIRDHLYSEAGANGKIRFRFQLNRNSPKVTIKGQPNEPIFEKQYQALKNGYTCHRPKKQSITRLYNPEACATYGDLVSCFLKHMDDEARRDMITDGTRNTYAGILKRTLPALATLSITQFDRAALQSVLDGLTSTPPTHNNLLKALKKMFKFAHYKAQVIDHDPSKDLQPQPYKTAGHLAWADHQIDQFLSHHPIGTTAHLTMMLYLHTTCRRSDVVLIGPRDLHEYKGQKYIEFVQFKNRRSDKQPVYAHVTPYLAEVLDQTKTGESTFIINEYGKPFSAKGFGNRMKKWIIEAGLPNNIASHGIRKTMGSIFAESDCTPYQIMAAQGHSSPKASEIYTKNANRRSLADQAYQNADIANRFNLNQGASK